MFMMLFFSLKRYDRQIIHDTSSSNINTTITRTPSITSKRKRFSLRRIWSQLIIVMVFLAFAMVLTCKLDKLQYLNTSISNNLFMNNSTYYIATPPRHVLEQNPSTQVDNAATTNVMFNSKQSSVDYMACCGAGHRLSKMTDAYYLAQRLNYTLRGYWGYCNTTTTTGQYTEVFHHLFGPQTIPMSNDVEADPKSTTDHNHYARINNDVPGFQRLIRDGKQCASCYSDKSISDYNFYSNLRDRFRLRESVVDDYYRNNLQGMSNRTIVGMHIRAGNGESGDFSIRGRNIKNTDVWLENLTNLLLTQSRIKKWNDPILFVATDTPSLIHRLRTSLSHMKWANQSTIEVINRDQLVLSEGYGVLFGQQGKVEQEGANCLQGWEDSIVDMMLLSHVDVLIAARPSSFIQSLPMSLILGRSESFRRFIDPYCEVNQDATEMQCFVNFTDWCCRGRTSFALLGIQIYDYLRMPGNLFNAEIKGSDQSMQKTLKIQQRPGYGCIPRPAGFKQTCLPYDWSNFVVTPQPSIMEVK